MSQASKNTLYAVSLSSAQGQKLSYLWDTSEVLEIAAVPGSYLYFENETAVLVNTDAKTCSPVSTSSVSTNVDCGDFQMSLQFLDPGQAVTQEDVQKYAHMDFALNQQVQLEADELVFRGYLKHATMAAIAVVCVSLGVSHFNADKTEQAELVELEKKKVPVVKTKKIKGLPSQKSLEQAYQKAMAKSSAARPAAKPGAAKAVAKTSAVDKVKAAFSGLLSNGISLPSQAKRSGSGAPAAQLSGAVRSGRSGGVAARKTGDSIVKVAMIGGGEGGSGGYGVGGSAAGIGIGGLSGQGDDWVALNVDDATVEEGLSRDEVGQVIHKKISEIRYCYEASILRTPNLEGKLIVDFTIAASGRVRSAKVNKETVSDARLNECILKRLTKWGFPKPKAGVEVAVSYPFIFKRLGR